LQLIIPDTRVPNKWNEEWPDINKEQGNTPLFLHSLKSDGHVDSGCVSTAIVSDSVSAFSFSSHGLNLQPLSGSLTTKIPVFLHSLKSDGHGDSLADNSKESDKAESVTASFAFLAAAREGLGVGADDVG
jgi:hypothetical protein